jgi:hypothetical protein
MRAICDFSANDGSTPETVPDSGLGAKTITSKKMETGMRNARLSRIRLCAAIALAIGLGSLAAHADNFYSSGTAWAAALSSSPTTINFEGIGAPYTGTTGTLGAGPGTSTTVGGVSFGIGPSGTNNFLVIGGDGSYYPVSELSAQPTDQVNPADFLISLPSSVTAVGFDFGALYVDSTATITLSDGSVQTVDAPASTDLAFFGVTAPGGIDSVDITLPGGDNTFGLAVADFSYGAAAASVTPEPPSFLFLGSGMVVFAVGMLRRKIWRAPMGR